MYVLCMPVTINDHVICSPGIARGECLWAKIESQSHEQHTGVRWHARPGKLWISRTLKRDFLPFDMSF